jgi:hypothetical protein
MVDAKRPDYMDNTQFKETGRTANIKGVFGWDTYSEVDFGQGYTKQDFLDSNWEETKDSNGNDVLIPSIRNFGYYVTVSSLPEKKSPGLTGLAVIMGLFGMACLKRRTGR